MSGRRHISERRVRACGKPPTPSMGQNVYVRGGAEPAGHYIPSQPHLYLRVAHAPALHFVGEDAYQLTKKPIDRS
jgi:hypothetical protein